MPADTPTRTRRSGFAPLCAKFWAPLCLALSCLNPSPDDQPSDKDDLSSQVDIPAGSQTPPANGGDGTNLEDGSESTAAPSRNPDQPGEADAGVPPSDAGPSGDAAVQ